MSNYHPPCCKVCGALRDDGVHISKRKLCPPCGEARMRDTTIALATGTGPEYERYQARQIEGTVRYLERLGVL